MKYFGYFWECYDEKTGAVVNSGFIKGDKIPTHWDSPVNGFNYRFTGLLSEHELAKHRPPNTPRREI